MPGTLKHRHQSALPNTGADVSSSAWNDSFVAAGGVNGQVMTRDSTKPDGWDWAPPPSSVVPSLSAFTQAVLPATLAISTEGVIDWLSMIATALPRTAAAGGVHGKASGGPLAMGFDWIVNGGTLFTFASTMAVTSIAGDDLATAVLAANTGAVAINNAAGGALNFGFRLRVPACPTIRTLRMYAGVFSGTVTFTAALSSGAVAPQTTTMVLGAGLNAVKKIDISFADTSGELSITALLTTNLGSTPNVAFQAATMF